MEPKEKLGRGRPPKREAKDTVQFSVYLPKRIHRAFRHYAFDRDVSMNDVVVALVKRVVRRAGLLGEEAEGSAIGSSAERNYARGKFREELAREVEKRGKKPKAAEPVKKPEPEQ